jgi:transposase
MSNKLFEAALNISDPWFVQGIDFDESKKLLTIGIDFVAGTRFPHPDAEGLHPVHDTQIKRLRHLNFFQHECILEVRVPRVRLPDGKVRVVDPKWAGQLDGFTLLFEAMILMLCRHMPFAVVARMVNLSWHRVHAICTRYVDITVANTNLSSVTDVAIDETSSKKGYEYLTIAADMAARKVIFVTPGKDAKTIEAFAEHLASHQASADQITSVSIDMSPAFISGVEKYLPNARITFDKFHVIAHASDAVTTTRRIEQKVDPDLKGMRWTLLKNRDKLCKEQRDDLDTLLAQYTTRRTARAWLYREQLRDILDRKQINVVTAMLSQWCTNVLRSKVEAMKEVARMIRKHFDGVVAWAQTRQTNGFIEAINGLFQAAKRKARGFTRFETMRTVLFLIAGKLDFSKINPHAA